MSVLSRGAAFSGQVIVQSAAIDVDRADRRASCRFPRIGRVKLAEVNWRAEVNEWCEDPCEEVQLRVAHVTSTYLPLVSRCRSRLVIHSPTWTCHLDVGTEKRERSSVQTNAATRTRNSRPLNSENANADAFLFLPRSELAPANWRFAGTPERWAPRAALRSPIGRGARHSWRSADPECTHTYKHGLYYAVRTTVALHRGCCCCRLARGAARRAGPSTTREMLG